MSLEIWSKSSHVYARKTRNAAVQATFLVRSVSKVFVVKMDGTITRTHRIRFFSPQYLDPLFFLQRTMNMWREKYGRFYRHDETMLPAHTHAINLTPKRRCNVLFVFVSTKRCHRCGTWLHISTLTVGRE